MVSTVLWSFYQLLLGFFISGTIAIAAFASTMEDPQTADKLDWKIRWTIIGAATLLIFAVIMSNFGPRWAEAFLQAFQTTTFEEKLLLLGIHSILLAVTFWVTCAIGLLIFWLAKPSPRPLYAELP
ncbi:MAG: hypothetical protein ACE5OZ_17175 [Candidatus Heimdallarchaeota archaeon]